MLSSRILVLFLAGLITLASGCSSRKPVEVLVTLDGTPLEGASVTLISEGTTGAINGISGANGIAKIDSSNKGGVAPGTYKVLVSKGKSMGEGPPDMKGGDYTKMMKGASKGPKSELPAIYNNPKETPLTLTVPPPSSPAKIELKKQS